ncbi:MAG TPA: tetratricopeptide repeat protein [Syntrophorhabdales bacterium]|nr:tetratricopeptide repeat protein [Syntrophorhabdales bacterium]
MTKRKVKEDLKKPDFMMVALERATTWIKEHVRLCIIVLSALIVIGLGLTGYRIYESREDDRLQYQLEEGVAAYQEFTTNGSGQALQKAESAFKAVSASRHKHLDEIAKLYLAKIYYTQGKNEDARSIYLDVKSRTSSSILRSLAETALQRIGQPAK